MFKKASCFLYVFKSSFCFRYDSLNIKDKSECLTKIGKCQSHTQKKQPIELQLPADNSNQMMYLANTLQEMRTLIVQFKQQQSSRPIQEVTSCNDNNKDSIKKVNKGNPNVNGQERTKDHSDDDILIHVSGDEIGDNANKKEQESNVPVARDQDKI